LPLQQKRPLELAPNRGQAVTIFSSLIEQKSPKQNEQNSSSCLPTAIDKQGKSTEACHLYERLEYRVAETYCVDLILRQRGMMMRSALLIMRNWKDEEGCEREGTICEGSGSEAANNVKEGHHKK